MADNFSCPLPTASFDPLVRAQNASARLSWLLESKIRGQQWLSVQRSSVDLQLAMDVIAGTDDTSVSGDTLSDIRSSEVKRCIKELIAELSNLRSEGQVRTENKEQYDKATILQKRYKSWWGMTKAKRKVRDAVAYAAVMGTGGISPIWDPNFYGPGLGDVRLKTFGPGNMLPDGLPPDGDFQRAYVVHLIEEMPIHEARRMYPSFADRITPDRGSPSAASKRIATFERWLSPVLNMFGVRGGEKQNDQLSFPTVDIIHSYVMDGSINTTGETVTMGTVGTTWEYQVPSLGSDVDTGLRTKTGEKMFRKATPLDAMLYPLRRKITWCSTVVLDDDSSPYWHGMVPLVRIKIDDWPWEANGYSTTRDVACVQRSITGHMRNIDDSANCRLNPPLVYDENLMSDSLAEKLNTRVPGGRIKGNLQMGDMVKPMIPVAYYDIPAIIPDWVKYLVENVKRLCYVSDVQAITKARQLPSSDSLDKMIEMAGPVVRDMLDGIELSMTDLGRMQVYNFFQFDSYSRRIEILGNDSTTAEDFDYEPGTLIPSHLPNENPEDGPSQYPPYIRAKTTVPTYYFYVTPGSLHDQRKTQAKLMLLQAKKAGLPIDRWTLANYFDVEGYGAPPEGTHTVMERVMAEERMQQEMQVELAKKLQAAGVQGGQGPGRPSTGHAPPQLQQKDGNTRSTVATSR